jgi:hypothetical protein
MFNERISTRTLLACGIVAGVLFPIVTLIQGLTRKGFDLARMPLSLLSVGSMGWIQISNFIVAGILMIAFAAGIRLVLHPGRAGTWGPLLIGLYGAINIVAGIFSTDPMYGFPPGTPEGLPLTLSWHAIIHNIAFIVIFFSLIGAQLVFARRFVALKQWGWAMYSVIIAIATPVLIMLAYANQTLFGMILFSMGVLNNIWLVLIAVRLLAEQK